MPMQSTIMVTIQRSGSITNIVTTPMNAMSPRNPIMAKTLSSICLLSLDSVVARS